MIPRSITEIKTMVTEESIGCKECIHYSGNTTMILKVEDNQSLIMTYDYRDSNKPQKAEIVNMDAETVIALLNCKEDSIRGGSSNQCEEPKELSKQKACAIARLSKNDIGPVSLTYEEICKYLVDNNISHLSEALLIEGVSLIIKGELDTFIYMKWDDDPKAAPTCIRINTRSYDDYVTSVIFSDSSLDSKFNGDQELRFDVITDIITRLRRSKL